MKAFLAWLIEVLVNLYERLYGDDVPPTKIVWEVRVHPGKRGAVRDKPNLEYPVVWLLQENELATVGVNDDGTLQKVVLDSRNVFYYIRFGKKVGWLKWKEGEMYLISKEVPIE